MELLVPIAILAVMWAVLILPQQRRVKAHRAYVDSLHVGDEVVTTAGVYGTVTALDGERARLRIAPDVEITVARMSIGRPQSTVPGDDTGDTEDTDDTADPAAPQATDPTPDDHE